MARTEYLCDGTAEDGDCPRLVDPGSGGIKINKRELDNYFGRPTSKMVFASPSRPRRRSAAMTFTRMSAAVVSRPGGRNPPRRDARADD